MRDIKSRIQRIHDKLAPSTACPECQGRPTRITGTDKTSGTITSETHPEDGCALCGAPFVVEVRLPGINVDRL